MQGDLKSLTSLPLPPTLSPPQAVSALESVIRRAPSLADPYATLSLVHEARGDRRKALNLAMIAAHMQPKDTDRWRRLAAASL